MESATRVPEFSGVISECVKSSAHHLPLLRLPVDDEQHQPVAQNTEEEHEVEEDGQPRAKVVVVGWIARRHHCEVVVVLNRRGFHC